VQPLVENAIVHGLEPKIEGGSVRIEARATVVGLVIRVEDDGLGLVQAGAGPARRGQGSALVNIRERLRHAFGAGAGLTVESRAPHGVRATLTLPADEETQ
jgi:LytS/YehU family sensor histidine kinase